MGEYHCHCRIAVLDDASESGVHQIYGISDLLGKELKASGQAIGNPGPHSRSMTSTHPDVKQILPGDKWELKYTPLQP